MTDPERTRPGYRPAVGIMLINPLGLVFVGRRVDREEEAWQMPQGGIDAGESPRQAALRELGEEVGTDKAEIIGETPGWLRYEVPAELVPPNWDPRHRGQDQKWFAMRFTGHDSDIALDAHTPEFSAWRWVEADELIRLIVPFKRPVYEQVVAAFRPTIEAIKQRRG